MLECEGFRGPTNYHGWNVDSYMAYSDLIGPSSLPSKTFHWSNPPGNVQLHFTLEGEEGMRGPTNYHGWNVYVDSYMADYDLIAKSPLPSKTSRWSNKPGNVQLYCTLEGEGLRGPTTYHGWNVYMDSYMVDYDLIVIIIMFHVCRNLHYAHHQEVGVTHIPANHTKSRALNN
jgi:hypothetical protein